jgi:hypothetical protein
MNVRCSLLYSLSEIFLARVGIKCAALVAEDPPQTLELTVSP